MLEFHHVRGNGDLHRRVLRALDTGTVGWILDCPDPGRSLFALEVLCVICDRMHHEAGGRPHRKEVRRRRALAQPGLQAERQTTVEPGHGHKGDQKRKK